ncbi:MAG TPA: glycosyl hydrolase [Dongiaceae bacterium]|nr:glycosyl hydrolase [Dongiaceae bacterium]
MRVKLVVFGASAVGVIGILVAALLILRSHNQASPIPLVSLTSIKTLPIKSASSADTSHIDASIVPPTNSWLSGMVLQKVPEPVYPLPLSFLAKDTGFEIGLPTITSTSTVISGEHVPGIIADIDQAQRFTLSRYDKVSATLAYTNSESKLIGSLTIAEGSPYVFFESANDSQLTLQGIDMTTVKLETLGHYLRYTKDGHDYVAMISGDGTVAAHSGSFIISLKKGAFATFYAIPSTGTDTLRTYAGNKLTGVDTSGTLATSNAETSLTYKTANGQPTVFAAPGYETVKSRSQTLLTYDSIYGPMAMSAGTNLVTTAPRITPSSDLNLTRLTNEHRQSIIDSLKQDAAHTSITATDSYYAGKQLARLANLLTIAKQLGQTSVANSLTTALRTELTKRLGSAYFYYDSKLHGIAAQTKAFGSEDFNDHHFHYGYFIYAASVLARYDPQFVATYQNQVNLLVADIASYDPTAYFPVQRTYDPYAGHSWAAGLAPFADGNNQESSSEAMNAWNAVALWGQVTHNDKLADSGAWMLANEGASAQRLWRSPPEKTLETNQFTSPLTSLNFGGKRAYATFFSDDANAKLAIQLIPINPSMVSLASDGNMINRQLEAAIQNDTYNVPLGDYSLMYLALHDSQKAAMLVKSQQDTFIDDGDSRAYLEAWVYSQSDR